MFPIFGVALNKRSRSTVPRKPVPPVTKIFLPAKKLAIVERSSLTSFELSLAMLISSIVRVCVSSFNVAPDTETKTDELDKLTVCKKNCFLKALRSTFRIRLYRATHRRELNVKRPSECCDFQLFSFSAPLQVFLSVFFRLRWWERRFNSKINRLRFLTDTTFHVAGFFSLLIYVSVAIVFMTLKS